MRGFRYSPGEPEISIETLHGFAFQLGKRSANASRNSCTLLMVRYVPLTTRRVDPRSGDILAKSVPVKRPSRFALFLGLVPFIAMCFSVTLWDRLYPMILGIPFNLAWLLCWIVLSVLCMWVAYRLESKRDREDGGTR